MALSGQHRIVVTANSEVASEARRTLGLRRRQGTRPGVTLGPEGPGLARGTTGQRRHWHSGASGGLRPRGAPFPVDSEAEVPGRVGERGFSPFPVPGSGRIEDSRFPRFPRKKSAETRGIGTRSPSSRVTSINCGGNFIEAESALVYSAASIMVLSAGASMCGSCQCYTACCCK